MNCRDFIREKKAGIREQGTVRSCTLEISAIPAETSLRSADGASGTKPADLAGLRCGPGPTTDSLPWYEAEPDGNGATINAAYLRFLPAVATLSETGLPEANSICAGRPAYRSSVYEASPHGSHWHYPAEVHDQVLKATAETNPCPRWLPHQHAPVCLPNHDRIPLPLLMAQPALTVLARLRIHKCDLLETGMKITSYNHHARLLSSRALGRQATTNLLGWPGADAVMPSGVRSETWNTQSFVVG